MCVTLLSLISRLRDHAGFPLTYSSGIQLSLDFQWQCVLLYCRHQSWQQSCPGLRDIILLLCPDPGIWQHIVFIQVGRSESAHVVNGREADHRLLHTPPVMRSIVQLSSALPRRVCDDPSSEAFISRIVRYTLDRSRPIP